MADSQIVIDRDWLDRREREWLAPYAMHSRDSAGRQHPEPAHPYRGPYQRDRDRIVHCSAFRRLAHKMQVFTGDAGDYHRTRLTHTMEVASLARTLGRALRLNEDLIEALALVHDLGHPPFGHAGEDVLDDCLEHAGGFSHNRQALRIVELLERRYPEFPGLNLSHEIREGQAAREKGRSKESPLLEVQVVEAADSAAYNAHDADDALELGLIQLGDLEGVALWRAADERISQRYAGLDEAERRRAVVRELIDWQVSDLLQSTASRLADSAIDSVRGVRAATILVEHTSELQSLRADLERFLHQHVYRHPQLLALRSQAQEVLRTAFAAMRGRPQRMPERNQELVLEHGLERTVGDYLASLTDRSLMQVHEQLKLAGSVANTP